jgi:hypothetical protein
MASKLTVTTYPLQQHEDLNFKERGDIHSCVSVTKMMTIVHVTINHTADRDNHSWKRVESRGVGGGGGS